MKNSSIRLLAVSGLVGLLGLVGSPAARAQTKSTKRGVAYGFTSAADLQALAPGLSWWYNWAPAPDASVVNAYQALGLEYAPLQWNGTLNGAPVTADALAAKIPAGAKFLLGFNEPNFKSQANLTPTQAAALWPVLQEVARRKNLKLVSPAVNYCGDCVQENGTTYSSPTQYLDAFFAACPSCQVDYIAVHTYVCEEQYLRQKIAELKKYNKPIWVTEFACGDLPAAQITLGLQQKYLTDAVNYLENDPAIFRYAWFSGRNNQIPNINLLGANGQLTALGQLYVAQPYAGSPLLANRLTPVGATASSTEKPEVAAAKAIDGDILTRWASAWSDPQYLQLDYGTVQQFAHVRLSWEAGYAADYQLQTSLDGTTWTTIQSVSNGDGGVDDFTGLSGSGRYLRVYGTRRGTSYGYSLYEITAYGKPATTPAPAATPTLIQAESSSSLSGVGLETTTDTGGGQDVGWIDAGDKLTYPGMVFPSTGTYTLEYRVASPGGGSLAASLNGTALGGTQALAATGGWQSWKTVTQTVSVTAGTYTLGLQAIAGGWNINWLRITPPATSGSAARVAAATSASPAELPAQAELEVYPNPAATQVQLRSPHDLTGSQYQLVNALGQVVGSGAADAGSIDVAGLPAGLYTVRLAVAGQRLTRHFVKL